MVAFIFPGQGSQFTGMGKDIYDAFPETRKIFDQAEGVLGFALKKFCFEGPEEALKQTNICQPAILTVSIALLEAFRLNADNYPTPIFTAGLSLGEYTALVASGILTFEDGLLLVKKRAELMEAAAGKHPGKMAAVLGIGKQDLEKICQDTGAEIANLNCPGQIVITGAAGSVEKAQELSLAKGAKRVINLEVSGAFHSSLMKDAALEFKISLDDCALYPVSIPVISNVTARPQIKVSEIKENLIKQIFSPVRWEDSIRFLAGSGVNLFYEIGPGSILKGLLRKIDSKLEVRNISSLKVLK